MTAFFVCDCLFDFSIVLKSKFSFNIFIDLSEQNGIMRPHIFFFFLVDSTYYICAKKILNFWLNIILTFMKNVWNIVLVNILILSHVIVWICMRWDMKISVFLVKKLQFLFF